MVLGLSSFAIGESPFFKLNLPDNFLLRLRTTPLLLPPTVLTPDVESGFAPFGGVGGVRTARVGRNDLTAGIGSAGLILLPAPPSFSAFSDAALLRLLDLDRAGGGWCNWSVCRGEACVGSKSREEAVDGMGDGDVEALGLAPRLDSDPWDEGARRLVELEACCCWYARMMAEAGVSARCCCDMGGWDCEVRL